MTMTPEQKVRELLDTIVYDYISMYKGMDYADDVDYSTLDEWLEDITGHSNPLVEEQV